MKSKAVKVAVCGVTGALGLVFMLGGVLFPLAVYACPAAAAFLLFPVAYEYGVKTAFVMYCAVSVLSFILVPDPECVFVYVFIFGLYTVLKFPVDRIKSKGIRYLVKFLYINLAVIICYSILMFFFPTLPRVTEIKDYTLGFVLLLFVMFNACFFCYDKAREKMLMIYIVRLRKRIFRK